MRGNGVLSLGDLVKDKRFLCLLILNSLINHTGENYSIRQRNILSYLEDKNVMREIWDLHSLSE